MKKKNVSDRIQEQFDFGQSYEKISNMAGIEKKPARPKSLFWKIAIPVGVSAVAIAAAVTAVSLSGKGQGVLSPIPFDNNIVPTNAYLTKPAPREAVEEMICVSPSSVQVYQNFVERFVPALFASQEDGQTVTFSVFDAFANVAVNAYLAADAQREQLLGLFGNVSIEEVTLAVKELTWALGTPDGRNYQEGSKGNYSFNAILLDPNQIQASPTSADVLPTLEESYYTTVLQQTPTTENVVGLLEENVPEEYRPLPKIELDDSAPNPALSLSSFFIKKDYTDYVKQSHRQEYESKNHYMDYHLGGVTKKVDYISSLTTHEFMPVYQGDGFIGSCQTSLDIDFFLPEENLGLDELIEKVATKDYATSSNMFLRHEIKAPYFKAESDLSLMEPLKNAGCTNLRAGMLEHLVGAPGMGLVKAKQNNFMKYDYEGFYSASVTYFEYATSAGGEPTETFELILDRPFVFSTFDSVLVEGQYGKTKLPTTFGQIVDPGYEVFTRK